MLLLPNSVQIDLGCSSASTSSLHISTAVSCNINKLHVLVCSCQGLTPLQESTTPTARVCFVKSDSSEFSRLAHPSLRRCGCRPFLGKEGARSSARSLGFAAPAPSSSFCKSNRRGKQTNLQRTEENWHFPISRDMVWKSICLLKDFFCL